MRLNQFIHPEFQNRLVRKKKKPVAARQETICKVPVGKMTPEKKNAVIETSPAANRVAYVGVVDGITGDQRYFCEQITWRAKREKKRICFVIPKTCRRKETRREKN